MIIFDLDGTLADCEHRRYMLDPSKYPKQFEFSNYKNVDGKAIIDEDFRAKWRSKSTGEPIAHGWQSFYEACDQDKPIEPVMGMFFKLLEEQDEEIEIWSGRCESVQEKTEKWIKHQLDWQFGFDPHFQWTYSLQMRPEGDSTPDDQLKEMWLDQEIAEGKKIKFVFDDRPKVIRMWRKRGIFVFNCCQHNEEF